MKYKLCIMKIELKHLAPYLPYGLKLQTTSWECPIREVVGVGLEGVSTDGKDRILFFKHTDVKPILRPLSDLTKEIEIDGKKFIPSEWLDKNLPNTPNFKHLRGTTTWNYYQNKLHGSYVEYAVMEKLFEWHFDVFGLIEAGLAIDINTLKK